MIRTARFQITTDSSGAGTALSSVPLNGEIASIGAGTAWGTAHITLTRLDDGKDFYGGAVSGTAFPLPRPVVCGYVTVKVKGGGSKKADTVRVYYSEDD